MNIHNGRNTEPRYDIRLASKASATVSDKDIVKYPAFMINTEINNKTNQMSLSFIRLQYPTINNNAMMAITP